MKKSMLHRSFKPAKCKTALKLAVSRIKLLKNKRDAQVKVMKRELAQLLQSGQERTARIRVEHVVMEEKIMTAYELIEIYCELIAARLPIIESQKNCPVDLKEAIASVIYASPRCADIPELADARKHLTAKYGKEFASAALELRPNSGVSRMLVEKLSAKAPDGPTKMKILSGIAAEHNITWEPESFEEKELKPPDDLLDGAKTFEKSTMMHGESKVLTPNHLEKGPSNSYSQPDQHAERDAYSNFHQQNSGLSPQSQNVAPHFDAYNAMHHARRPEARPPVEGGECGHSYSGVLGEPSKKGHNWNMEFKDATAAAQAAAESAERASMAARAAAELSSRGQNTTQYSVDSRQSSINIRRDEALQNEHPPVPSHHRQAAGISSIDSQLSSTGSRKVFSQDYDGRKSQEEDLSGDCSSNNIYGNRNSGLQWNNLDEVEQHNFASVGSRFHNDHSTTADEPSGSASHKYNPATINDDLTSNPFGMEENNASKNSLKQEKREFMTDMQYDTKSERIDPFLQPDTERQSSHVSYSSQSGNFSNDGDILTLGNQKSGDYSDNKSFVDFDQYKYQERPREKEASDKKSIAFDDSGSDNDGDYTYDIMGDHKGQHSDILFSSPGRIPPTNISEVKNSGSPYAYIDDSPKASISELQSSLNQHVFSESLTTPVIPSEPDELPPVIFDDLDGSSSEEEEEEVHKVKLYDFHSTEGSLSEEVNNYSRTSFVKEENASFVGKLLPLPSSHSSDPLEGQHERYQGNNFNDESQETLDSPIRLPSRPLQQMQSNEVDGISFINADKETEHFLDSPLGSGKELNLGTLTGGLRNKGYRRSPYLNNTSGDSTCTQLVEDHSAETEPSYSLPAFRTSVIYQDPIDRKEDLTSNQKYFDSDNESSDEEFTSKTFKTRQQSYVSNARSGVGNKPDLKIQRAPTYFDSDSEEPAEDLPRQSLASKGRPAPAFSCRTKGSQTSQKTASKTTTEASSNSSARGPLSSSQSQFRNSNYGRKFEQPNSVNQAATSKPIQEYKSPLVGRNLAPSETEQSKSTISKATSGSAEGSKTSSSTEKNLSRLDSTTRHVHPNLPDFDSFVAHMKSLRKSHE